MVEDIVNKISDELSRGIDSEPQVLYLLVEIRKIRQANLGNNKTFLDFYRDWACHVELTHNDAVDIFLNRFEILVDPNLTAHKIAKSFVSRFPSFFKLDELRKELRVFFKDKELTTELTDDGKKWYTFVKHLLGILKDCNIKRLGSNGKIEGLSLEVDNQGNAKFKFRLRGRRDLPVCKLKWK